LEGNGWLATFEGSVEVEIEDIPDEVMAARPGIGWLSRVNIEPSGAPGGAKREIRGFLKILAKDFRGVIEALLGSLKSMSITGRA
jgi:hypothetical protein